MTDRFAISPFGGKGLVRAQFIVNEQVRRAQRTLDTPGSSPRDEKAGRAVDKWQLLRAVTEAHGELGLSDRTIVVLEALASFHKERLLDPAVSLIVFPSNTELSLRARGMAPATLRRHLSALVETGLILRRDSANGKRYARRDEDGHIEAAFGFDLAPLVMRAAEIEAMAAKARQMARALRALRSEITIHLRDIAAILRTAGEEGRGGAFADLRERFAVLSGRLGRNTPWEVLKARCDSLASLRRDIEKTYLNGLSEEELEAREFQETVAETQEVSANDSQNERHIQESQTDSINENIKEGFETQPPVPREITLKGDSWQRESPKPQKAATNPATASGPVLNIAVVLAACPQIRDYSPGGLNGWRDLLKAADTVRTMLGVSPRAWMQARAEMGEINAAVTMAAILEQAETIRSPGGYLHRLTERARDGGFSVKPMLNALLTARQLGRVKSGGGEGQRV